MSVRFYDYPLRGKFTKSKQHEEFQDEEKSVNICGIFYRIPREGGVKNKMGDKIYRISPIRYNRKGKSEDKIR